MECKENSNIDHADFYDVCIIGGGLAGLAAAIALQQYTKKYNQCGNIFRIKVLERDRQFTDRKQGYGLTLTNSRSGPLAQLGLLDECIAQNCPSHSHYVFNPTGKVLGYFGRALRKEGADDKIDVGGNRGNLRIPRQILRQLLLQQLEPGTVEWGWQIIDYVESDEIDADDGHVTVHLAPTAGQHSDTLITAEDCRSELRIRKLQCRVLIGADGIHSRVRLLKDQKMQIENISPLRYIGISVIIGLSTTLHPLLQQRGFYVLDGTHRLFIMPYKQANESKDGTKDITLTMWQLSFSGWTEVQAQWLRAASNTELLHEAKQRAKHWFDPVPALIDGTVSGEVWGTGLYDRDPMPLPMKSRKRKLQDSLKNSGDDSHNDGTRYYDSSLSLVTVIGDAAHPMSMFKGQGANQALADGPLLAKWLFSCTKSDFKSASTIQEINKIWAVSRRQLHTKLRCFEREMIARSAPKVLGSRSAAQFLHSPAALQTIGPCDNGSKVPTEESKSSYFSNTELGLAGISKIQWEIHGGQLLQFLEENDVTAKCGIALDARMRAVVDAYFASKS